MTYKCIWTEQKLTDNLNPTLLSLIRVLIPLKWVARCIILKTKQPKLGRIHMTFFTRFTVNLSSNKKFILLIWKAWKSKNKISLKYPCALSGFLSGGRNKATPFYLTTIYMYPAWIHCGYKRYHSIQQYQPNHNVTCL